MFELQNPYLTMTIHLLLATLAGGAIGLERTYRGRPAGFRTHALVCTASCLLMLVTAFQYLWFDPVAHGLDRIVFDPTRMSQGIMTGIGFLGAGVIMKDGLSVRGLTTAASIWVTAAIGILIGIGFYFPAGIALVLTLGTLSVFSHIEQWIPSNAFAELTVRFPAAGRMDEAGFRALIAKAGFGSDKMHYAMNRGEDHFEYRIAIRTKRKEDMTRLADQLAAMPEVSEFRILQSGE